jgi:eukaryotic-like serine/threonine-protein kinase
LEREAGVIIAGRYRLVEKLGSGGMGAVWLADDLSLDSHCAVKLIDPEKSRSEEVRKRFVREAKAAAQLRGPHVVDVFDRGEFEGVLYIAMEYLEGEDLCTRLNRVGVLEPERTYRVIAHVSRALSSAHALGIVHRDLKPENIFLVPSYDEEIAKVLDFGIAQHAAYHLEDRATREGSFLGTPYYVSPEQARGRPTDHRSDLWSLAVITYQCLTGLPPFDSDSLGELMGLILYEPIPKITEANPDLPPEIEEWWTQATQRDRELRFQSARELTDQLGRALKVSAVVSVPTLPPRRQLSTFPDEGESRLTIGTLGARGTPPSHLSPVAPEATIESYSQGGRHALPLDAPKDPFGVTNLAVTRSRPSIHSVKQGIEWSYAQLRANPTQALLLAAMSLGILLGAIATFVAANRTINVTALGPAAGLTVQEPLIPSTSPQVSATATAKDAGPDSATAGEVVPVSSVEQLPPESESPPRAPSRTSPSRRGAAKKPHTDHNPWGI